jgi:hypothetical protein
LCFSKKFIIFSIFYYLMGLYTLIETLLPKQFSIYQLMGLLDMERENAREARNLLKQFVQKDLVKRIGPNMYEKLVFSGTTE